jgi:hypothetical protein
MGISTPTLEMRDEINARILKRVERRLGGESLRSVDEREVDDSFGHVIKVVGEHVHAHVCHDFDNLGVVVAGDTHGRELSVSHMPTILEHRFRKIECGLGLSFMPCSSEASL